MAKSSKHYLASGKLYTGATHKMGSKIHSGASHTASSKVLTHTKPKAKKPTAMAMASRKSGSKK